MHNIQILIFQAPGFRVVPMRLGTGSLVTEVANAGGINVTLAASLTTITIITDLREIGQEGLSG
jgi:hypothetical protein